VAQVYNRRIEITNHTRIHERGIAFLRAKSAHFACEGLQVHVKHTRAKGRDVNGWFRPRDLRIVLATKQRLRYPRRAAYGVATRATPDKQRRFDVVWHEETFHGPDDLFVFVAGHEVWHYLCASGQRKRDHETRANCHGFAWLREFRVWNGPGFPVAGIPELPARPDEASGTMMTMVPVSEPARPAPRIAALAPSAPTSASRPTPGRPTPGRPTPRRRRPADQTGAWTQLALFRE
jgi:hypothetical protein